VSCYCNPNHPRFPATFNFGNFACTTPGHDEGFNDQEFSWAWYGKDLFIGPWFTKAVPNGKGRGSQSEYVDSQILVYPSRLFGARGGPPHCRQRLAAARILIQKLNFFSVVDMKCMSFQDLFQTSFRYYGATVICFNAWFGTPAALNGRGTIICLKFWPHWTATEMVVYVNFWRSDRFEEPWHMGPLCRKRGLDLKGWVEECAEGRGKAG